MKIMIRSDVEGVTGVTTYQQAENSEFGRAMLSNDLFACIKGINATGSHEIIIYDEHTNGRNVDITNLPDNTSVIMGKPDYRPDWGGIDSSYDAMFMVGFHARSGVDGALLAHSYSRKNLNIRINSILVGEIGMEAAIAGDFDVPLWFITGDSAGIAEAEGIIKGIQTVSVKEAMGEFEACCYPPQLTRKRIYQAAKSTIALPPKVAPLKIKGPIELQIDLADSEYTTKLKNRYPQIFLDKTNTVQISTNTVTESWSKYLVIQREIKNT